MFWFHDVYCLLNLIVQTCTKRNFGKGYAETAKFYRGFCGRNEAQQSDGQPARYANESRPAFGDRYKAILSEGGSGKRSVWACHVLPSGFEFQKRSQLFNRTHNETLSVVAMCVRNEDCPGLYPVIRNSLVGLAPYPGKFRALNQIGEFHCHSLFSELRPLPVVVQ
jgi:hypothetical protein